MSTTRDPATSPLPSSPTSTAPSPSTSTSAAALRLPGPSVLPGARLTALLLVAAPIGEVIEAALSPLAGTTTGADLAGIAAHQMRFTVSVLIGLTSTLLLIPAFFGLTNACVLRSPRLARVAAWTMVASMCGFVAVRAVQAFELQVVRQGLDVATGARLVDGTAGNPVFAPLTVLFLGGQVVGIALLAVLTWRSAFPRAAVVLLVAFPVVDLANFTGGALGAVLSHIVLLASLTWMGRTLWTRATAQSPGSRASTASASAGIQPGAPSTSR